MTAEEQAEFVNILCRGEIINPTVRQRSVVRILAISHVQMSRTITELRDTIRQLNRENGRVVKWVIALTVVSVICGIVQAAGVIVNLCAH